MQILRNRKPTNFGNQFADHFAYELSPSTHNQLPTYKGKPFSQFLSRTEM